jgi:hypothetical protein
MFALSKSLAVALIAAIQVAVLNGTQYETENRLANESHRVDEYPLASEYVIGDWDWGAELFC